MRILIVTSTFPSKDTDPIPAFVKDQAIALKQEYPDIKIDILAPHDARSETKSLTRHKHYTEHRFHYFWPHSLEKLAGRGILPQLKKNPLYYTMIPFLFIAEYFALLRLASNLKPNYIYAHWFTPQGVVAGMVSKRKSIPYVITSHASDVIVWKKVPFGRRIVQHYSKQATAITAVSPRTLEKLKSFFTQSDWSAIEDKVKIIPMGVHLPTQQKESQRKPGQNILFIGRLAEKKGVQYLLPAFAQLAIDFPKAKLTIAGDGPLLAELKKQASTLSMSENQIHFAGHISGTSKQKYIDTADIYMVPSIITSSGDAEGLPVTLMEGLAAGKICIATNESGADNILQDSKSGFLVPQKDTAALEQAMRRALDLPQNKRAHMQKEAQHAAQQFDWPTIAKEHYTFFKEYTRSRHESTDR